MADIVEIKRLLVMQVQSVVEHLLPNGRKEGQEWRAGSTSGEKGSSLGVHLAGPRAGLWQDFANGSEKGDLLDLWCATRSVTLAVALDEAAAWLGVTRPAPAREPTRNYRRPAKPECVKPKEAVKLYLTEERNIPQAALDAYRVGEHERWMIFPYLRDGELVMVKHECIDRDDRGKKIVHSSAETEDCLFGWHVIPDDARELLITEGEKDALSWFAYGRPALSVPRGGGAGAKQKWIESDFERCERFERIYISTDMDEEGEAAAEEIAGRLGRHRCLRVRLPRKDANECLMDGITKAEMDRCIESAGGLDPVGLRRAADFADDVQRLFYPEPEQHIGYTVPYGKIASKLTFRPGELTVWSGATSAGKSQILSDCAVHWISEGSRVCVASLEMKPEQTLKRMVKQAANLDRPTPDWIRRTLAFLDQGLLLYDKVGKAPLEDLLEVFTYARAKYGCDQFVIDSLFRLGLASDDYNAQEELLFKLVSWALDNNVHVHFVAHARKGERGDHGVQGLDDVKGAGGIVGNAANVLIVWRNRRHEDDLKAAKEGTPEYAELVEKPGVILNVAKQRNGDFEGKVGLWFDQASYRYHSSFDRGSWSNRHYRIEQAIQTEPIDGALF